MKPKQPSRAMYFRSHMDASAFASILIVLLFILMSNTVPDIYSCGPIIDSCAPIIELPGSNHAIWMEGALREDSLVVAINRDGGIFFRNDQVHPDDLSGQIKERLSKGVEGRIYLRADSRVRYRAITRALDGIRDARVEKVGILTSQR